MIQVFRIDKQNKGGKWRSVEGVSQWKSHVVIKPYSDDVYQNCARFN